MLFLIYINALAFGPNDPQVRVYIKQSTRAHCITTRYIHMPINGFAHTAQKVYECGIHNGKVESSQEGIVETQSHCRLILNIYSLQVR